jgi:hypothetical protein
MNKKKVFLWLIALIFGLNIEGVAQTYGLQILNGTKLVIQSGTTVNVVNNLGTKIDGTDSGITNNGTLKMEGSFLNQNNAVVQNGSYIIGGSLTNTASFLNGAVFLENTTPAVLSSTTPLGSLSMNKVLPNTLVNLGSPIDITGALTFTKGQIQVNTFDLTCSAISGFSSSDFVITNSTGGLVSKVGSVALPPSGNVLPSDYPVGTSATSYTPIKIQPATQNFTDVFLKVVVKNNVNTDPNNAASTTITSGVVNKSWVVTAVGTPTAQNLTVTPQWNGADESSGFDGAKCGVSRWNTATSAWDLAWANVGAKAGAAPYTRTRSGITEVGTFAVGNKPVATYIQLSAKVILQGAYPITGTSGLLMGDGLRAAILPKTESTVAPSGQSPRPNGFTHQAWGGGEDVSIYGSFSSQAIANDNIVDWVFVELRDHLVSGTVLHTRAALLQKDGDIVNEDGTAPLKIYGVPDGNYYISIKHRNHLAVRSAVTKNLSRAATTVMDFTTNLSEALATHSGAAYNALATMIDGKYALWGGNINSDAVLRRTGPVNINDALLITNFLGIIQTISGTYNREDVNMNGTVTRSGPTIINDALRVTNYLGTNTAVLQPTF